MTTNNAYLAVFTVTRNSPRMQAWMALPEGERHAKEREGVAAWKAWVQKHQASIAVMGGPLGKTKQVSERGVADISNAMSGFMVINADSPDAAAALFEKHPSFSIFPGDGVEIMPVLPIPAG